MTWEKRIAGMFAGAGVLAALAMASGADSWMTGLIMFRFFH